MKKDMINREVVEGRLYQHSLELKTVQNQASANYGKEFITGTIDIATDEEGLNVIPVHYTYITETTSTGKKNVTFGVLKSIIDGVGKTWITDGKEAALKVRATPSLALNDFYNREGELVSARRNEGGFVNTINDLAPEAERNTFRCDMVITSVTTVEADEENGIPADYIKVKGAIFNFRKDILPVEFTCHDEGGMGYFESLDASPTNPIFTEVRGHIISNVITREIEEESAFGSASVRTVSRTVREWCIDWAKPVEYDFGADDTLTAEELKEAIQNREVYLAEVKKRQEEYQANSTTATAQTTAPKAEVPQGNFIF